MNEHIASPEQTDIHDVSTLLLPREKYAKESEKYTGPFSKYEIIKENQVLYYFGANHSRNIQNPQYPALKEYWQKFLADSEGKPRIVLVEGGVRPIHKDEDAAITSDCEAGLTALLAHNEKIDIASPDLSSEKLIEKLPDMNKEEVLLYWFLSYVDSLHKIADPKPPFEKYLTHWAHNQSKMERWKDFQITLPYLRELYKKVLGKDFDETESPNNLVNPNRTDSPINIIARRQSDLRDVNITEEIFRYWKEGKSVFVVFGRGHLIIEKPALEKLIT